MRTEEINQIVIQGLFHKYDVTIDLTKDCTILIGANGVGKSTALKLLKYLLSGNFINIATIPFDSIKIDGCVMPYNDFLVPVDELTKAFCAANGISVAVNAEMQKVFVEMVKELQDRDMLGDFLCDLFYAEEFSSSITSVIDKYLPANLVHRIDLPVFESPEREISSYQDVPVLKCEFVQKLLNNTYWRREVFYFDMVKKVQFPTYKEVESGVYSNAITEQRFAFAENGALSPFLSMGDYQNEDVQQFVESLRSVPITYRYGYSSKEIEADEYWDTRDVAQEFMIGLIRLSKKGIFDLNGFLNLIYYDPDFVAEVNGKAVQYIEDYYTKRDALRREELMIDIDGLLREFTPILISIHDQYIRPILIKHSLFDVSLERVIRKISNCSVQETTEEIALLLAYKSFFDDVYEDIVSEDNISQNIRALKDLLAQYLTDYDIVIAPKGMTLYFQTGEGGTVINEDITIFYSKNELSLDKLSSGECKIIALCFLALCSDYAILILDEPELSVSIIWQEKLLVDLLDYGTFTSIVVATHSPYIARHESLTEYINYLP